jgi:hypothetical protein
MNATPSSKEETLATRHRDSLASLERPVGDRAAARDIARPSLTRGRVESGESP